MGRRCVLMTLALAAGLAAGCLPRRPEPIPLERIVTDAEANTAKIEALAGRVAVAVRAPGKRLFASLDGRLAFARPNRVRLEISKFGRWEFDVGANDAEYWFWSKRAVLDEHENTLRVGRVADIERSAGRGLLLRPDVVADALGVSAIVPAEGGVMPERYDDAYVLNYVRVVDNRLLLVKKAYFDRLTGERTRTDYFAPNGTRILFITYGAWQEIDGVRLSRKVTVDLPLEKAAVRFDLGSLTLKPGLPEAAFAIPEIPGTRRIDLDAEP